jgi:hypothetical protein
MFGFGFGFGDVKYYQEYIFLFLRIFWHLFTSANIKADSISMKAIRKLFE